MKILKKDSFTMDSNFLGLFVLECSNRSIFSDEKYFRFFRRELDFWQNFKQSIKKFELCRRAKKNEALVQTGFNKLKNFFIFD